uniref:Uncharacterized protein n=1 Tax=Ixodes scapularis TaxID=6945 RepID=A0A4D5RDP7_IXOSC
MLAATLKRTLQRCVKALVVTFWGKALPSRWYRCGPPLVRWNSRKTARLLKSCQTSGSSTDTGSFTSLLIYSIYISAAKNGGVLCFLSVFSSCVVG